MHKSLNTSLAGKANSSHTHDNRYYTEAEINERFSLIANEHVHDNRYYTKAEMNMKLGGKSAVSHVHDDRYYTENEVNSKFVQNSGGKMTGVLTLSGKYGVTTDSFKGTYLVLEARCDADGDARASIGFHNAGKIGGTLYMELNGALWIRWNDGTSKCIITR